MQIVAVVSRAKYDFFRWRYELTIPRKLLLAFGIACLVGLLAQVRVYTPWTPVPITGQTFAALMAGVVMGRRWGGVSLAIYALLGIAGVPWFAPQAGMPLFSAGGISHLAGPTGGYIVGMILAALFLGYFTDKYVKARRFFSMLVSGTPTAVSAVIAMGAAPFIVGDILKSVLAAVTARAITPGEDYSR